MRFIRDSRRAWLEAPDIYRPNYALARRWAEQGYGYENIRAECGVSELWAKALVLGKRHAYAKFAAMRAKR